MGVGFFDEAVDGGLEVGDGGEHAALEASACELGEEAFDGVEPGRRGWSEVERPARMLGQPFAHLGMLVGGIIVDDGVDILGSGDLRVDGAEEADELLVAMGLTSRRKPKPCIPSTRASPAGGERMEGLPTVKKLRAALPPRAPIEHAREWAVSYRPKY